MSAFGGMVDGALSRLQGYVEAGTGKLLPGKEELANTAINEIKYVLGIDISLETIEDPEDPSQSYQAIKVGDEICTSSDMIYTDVTALGEGSTIDAFYTGESNLCVGVLSTTGGEYLAKAFTFSSGSYGYGANLQYRADPDDEHVFHVTCPNFKIEIEEATENNPARVMLYVTSGLYDLPVEPFNSEYYSQSGAPYLRYYLFKGDSGDCYFKGYYSNNATEIDPENAYEEFKDITMNIFSFDNDGVLQKETNVNGGGFAIVGMEQKVNVPDNQIDDDRVMPESDYKSPSYGPSDYAFVLWGLDGAPLIACLTPKTKELSKRYSCDAYRRIMTNAVDQIVSLAPIFCPGTEYLASVNSFWSLVISKDGMYDLAVDDSSKYRYDHGFALRIS